jgi:hypothetical protein
MDQDTVNAMKCVGATRAQLDELRREKWKKLLDEVYEFYDKNDISKLEMKDEYIDPKKQRHRSGLQTNITIKLIISMMLLIGYFKSLTTASMKQALSCLFARLLLVQETHFMILIWRI